MEVHVKMYRAIVYCKPLNGYPATMKDFELAFNHIRNIEFLTVKDVRETDIGPWTDDHALNKISANQAVYDSYFAELDTVDEADPWFKQEHKRVRSIMIAQIEKNTRLEQENAALKRKIEGLEKVQEFIKTVKDLSEG